MQRPARGAFPPPAVFFSGLDQLRGIGALLVVYSHLVGNFLDANGREWVVDNAVAAVLREPLHAELNFGWFGVALFFFVSGFVVTHSASRETAKAFAVRRLLRIYPPVFVTVVLVAAMAWLGTLVSGVTQAPDGRAVLLNALLANYVIIAPPALVAVGWTLVIEVLFYLGLLCTRWVLGPAPWAAPTILLVATMPVVLVGSRVGGAWLSLAASVAFIPLLLLGQVVYLVRMRRVGVPAGVLLTAACWTAFVISLHVVLPAFAAPVAGFLSNAALAGAVFVIAVLVEGRVGVSAPMSFLARRSYTIYLLHVPVGYTILTALVAAGMPYTPALVLALLSTAAATEVVYRLVERPSIRLGRWVTSSPRRRRVVAPAAAT